MNGRRRSRSLFLVILFLVTAYVLLFPFPLEPERVARPQWAIDLEVSAAAPAADRAVLPFRLGSLLGYHTVDGDLVHVEPVIYDAALGRELFVNYSRLPSNLVLKRPDGSFHGTVRSALYPLFDPRGNRMFLVDELGTGLSELDPDGVTLWHSEFGSLMTSAAVHRSLVLIGLLDGSVVAVDRQGRRIFSERVGGSRVSVVTGVGAGPGVLAAVAGLDPQMLVIWDNEPEGFVERLREPLQSDFRREVRLLVTRDGEAVFCEEAGGVRLARVDSGESRLLSATGELLALAEVPDAGLLVAAHDDRGRVHVRIWNRHGALLHRETVPRGEGGFHLGEAPGGLVLGYGSRLLRIDMERL